MLLQNLCQEVINLAITVDSIGQCTAGRSSSTVPWSILREVRRVGAVEHQRERLGLLEHEQLEHEQLERGPQGLELLELVLSLIHI